LSSNIELGIDSHVLGPISRLSNVNSRVQNVDTRVQNAISRDFDDATHVSSMVTGVSNAN